MQARPSKSLAAALPEDVALLIQVALSQDPYAALRGYVEHHRKEEKRCRQLSEGFLKDHKKKLALGGRLLKKAGEVHERYESAVASLAAADAGAPSDHAHKLRARALLLLQLGDAATIASLAAFRCWDEMVTEVNRHARQAEVVEGDALRAGPLLQLPPLARTDHSPHRHHGRPFQHAQVPGDGLPQPPSGAVRGLGVRAARLLCHPHSAGRRPRDGSAS